MAFLISISEGKATQWELEPSDVQFHHGSHGVRVGGHSFSFFPPLWSGILKYNLYVIKFTPFGV